MLEMLGWYTGILVMAAVPWVELIVAIPIGIGAGLNPITVGIVAFLGNALPVVFIIYGLDSFKEKQWVRTWCERLKSIRFFKKEWDDTKRVKKQERKQKLQTIFDKYGVAGLALTGPGITGIHLAAIVAVTFKASKQKVAVWMNVSLLIWTAVMTGMSFYGIDRLLGWLG
ncbi:small multidrug efflux protein - like protein [Salibacterium salarium]|uniref:Small multidrug efflux protein-like protein n=1 Tax=Salibacterium salarium TaxID=284579 RepID=A0A428MWH0_9BACI|nr:small multi-drug export protein [Salibacterium salarium]RSL30513.1 small multidrug efflux protein - like protein [Salibacterium salarium]